MPKVYLSPSVQERNVGTGAYGTEEYRMNQVADVVQELLKYNGFEVARNKPNMTLDEVVAESNRVRPDIHVAVHSNAGGGTGCEVWAYLVPNKVTNSQRLAQAVYDRLSAITPMADRGIKDGTKQKFAEIIRVQATSIIIEVAFHDNPGDAEWIVSNIQAIGEAITKGICDYFGMQFRKPAEGTPILGQSRATLQQAKAWAQARGATQEFVALADVYWRLGLAIGVRADGAYAQSAKETAFGRFGGEVTADMHNPCGLKTKDGKPAGSSPNVHQRFPDWEAGVRAHLEHLALYVGKEGYPLPDPVDPRHFPSLLGTAPTFEALGGKWAPSPEYGTSIVRDYLEPMLATKVPAQNDLPENPLQDTPAIVLPYNGPTEDKPGTLWYGNGYQGEGLYFRKKNGWYKIV